MSDVSEYNRKAWDHMAGKGNEWTVPVSDELIAQARQGNWSVVLTPLKPVPQDWFGPIAGQEILGLASGGGQQGPLFAAAGARVTILSLIHI